MVVSAKTISKRRYMKMSRTSSPLLTDTLYILDIGYGGDDGFTMLSPLTLFLIFYDDHTSQHSYLLNKTNSILLLDTGTRSFHFVSISFHLIFVKCAIILSLTKFAISPVFSKTHGMNTEYGFVKLNNYLVSFQIVKEFQDIFSRILSVRFK